MAASYHNHNHRINDHNHSERDKEKQLRSVFVGNIPFDVTEAELREKFETAGPIVSFRIVHDRESGKPKGYGFIEYLDQATANSCVRNLNNAEYNGRPLRVGPAAGGETANADNIKALQQALGGLQQESPYGSVVEPTEAPEAISKAVSSLPPEQMFELMKQMKLCIQNNPNEARNMLLQNPQLAYALLQAQIVMKIVDPQVAMALLHRERDSTPALKTDEPPKPVVPAPAPAPSNAGFRSSGGLLGERPGEQISSNRPPGLLDSRGPAPGDRWAGSQGPPSSVMDPRGAPPGIDRDRERDSRSGPHRGMDPRGPPLGMDPRGPPPGLDPRTPPGGTDPRLVSQGLDPRRDQRTIHPGLDPRGQPADRRELDRRDSVPRVHDADYRGHERGRSGPEYNRGGDPRDRRQGGLLEHPRGDMRSAMGGPGDMRPSMGGPGDMRQPMGGPGPSRGVPPSSTQFSPRQGGPLARPPAAAAADEEKEKAALIMQVLQLTDEQIQQLPPDQRQSILILKQQISGGR